MTSLLPVQLERVAVGTQRLAYERRPPVGEPSGEPIVLLHPWFGCTRFWDRTVEAIPERETFVVDLYSLGAQPGWEEFAAPPALSRAIEHFANVLALEKFCLVGNSMGGIVAQELAARLNGRISRLLLIGTGARTAGVQAEWREAIKAWVAGAADRGFSERMVAALLARRPADPDEFTRFVDAVDAANKLFMGAVLGAAFSLDLRPMLPKITAPTLVVRGTFDAARTRQHVAELLEGIPDSRAHEIANAGHSPQVDSPQAFCPVARDFLTRG